MRVPFNVPILAFIPKLPADGLPMLGDWMGTATSIWALNYEGWREPFEIKPSETAVAGQPLSFASVEVVKGCGRLTVLLFSIFWSYLHFKNQLDDSEKESLKQYLD